MDTPKLFQIVPVAPVDELPEPTQGEYFIAAGNGLFVHRKFHFGRVIVPAPKAVGNPDINPMLWYTFDPPIPHQVIGQAFSFFKAIYEKRKSEAMVDITWHKDHGYRLFVPPQQATGGGVKATRNPEHYVGQIVGTIHSHCDFGAGHSSTDTHDADGHDGVHITIGDVLQDKPSIAIMISVAKIRWHLELDDISDAPLTPAPHPEWWENFVKDPEPIPPVVRATSWPGRQPTAGQGTIIARAPAQRSMGYSALSLAELVWAFEDVLSDHEVNEATRADELISQADTILNKLGIDFEAEYTLDALGRSRQTKSVTPETWRNHQS